MCVMCKVKEAGPAPDTVCLQAPSTPPRPVSDTQEVLMLGLAAKKPQQGT